MHEYRYTLVRFVPDVERMEPTNVGVILQGRGRIDILLSPHAAKRKDIDTAIFQQWRRFLLEEVKGEATPLFQPPKSSPKFLDYLGGLCDSSVVLSKSLIVSVDPSESFDDLLARLFQRLVAPSPAIAAVEANRPTGRFRQLMEDYGFMQRGMIRYAHVTLPDERRWMPYRQVENGRLLAIDRVEVSNQIGRTANEIQSLTAPLYLLRDFLAHGVADHQAQYVLLADTLESPFTDQSQQEFTLMKDDLERAVDQVRDAGGTVIRSVPETNEFAKRLNECLPPATSI